MLPVSLPFVFHVRPSSFLVEYRGAFPSGDVMGPTLNNLHNLIRLPFGCGEQNMIHFAPIVYVMHYLQHTNQLDKETEIEANTFLVQGTAPGPSWARCHKALVVHTLSCAHHRILVYQTQGTCHCKMLWCSWSPA